MSGNFKDKGEEAGRRIGEKVDEAGRKAGEKRTRQVNG